MHGPKVKDTDAEAIIWERRESSPDPERDEEDCIGPAQVLFEASYESTVVFNLFLECDCRHEADSLK